MDMQQPIMAGQPDQEAKPGFTVCIQVNPDGTFAVGIDTPEQEAAEQPGQPEAGMKPAKDVKEALSMAYELMKSGGQPQAEAEQTAAADAFGAARMQR